jgi:hypothetical protein
MKKLIYLLFWPRNPTTRFFSISLVFFILSSLLPIYGVIFLDWQYFPILLFYFLEGLIWMFSRFLTAAALGKLYGRTYKYMPVWVQVFRTSTLLILGISVPSITMIIVASSHIKGAIESVSNFYFVVSAALLILSQVIQARTATQYRQNNDEKLSEGFFDLLRFFVFFAITAVLVSTNSFKIALIILTIIKTYIDIGSFLRLQALKNTKSIDSRLHQKKTYA